MQDGRSPEPPSGGGRKNIEKRIVAIGADVYCAVGYGLANSIMVGVSGGKVIIDTMESMAAAAEIREEFDRLHPGPVFAIIYTHSHPDHILGTSVFHEPGIPIWAYEKAVAEINDQFASLGKTLLYRGAKQFGRNLDESLKTGGGIGACLRLDEGSTPPLTYPTDTFSGRKNLSVGGVDFELHEAPGESHDQIFVWLPAAKILCCGDNIYRAFPNLYDTRGVRPRPVRGWLKSLQHMRALEAEHLVPGHTEPVTGKTEIQSLLTLYHDGIRFVHDSVIRLANEGKSPDEMAEEIRLPPHIREHPFMQETYGRLSWSIRGIYAGYLGWFDGNPTSLDRLPPGVHAEKMVGLAGGRERVLATLKEALQNRDHQWGLELADLLLAMDRDDREATAAKAEALRELGLQQASINARHYYLASSLELQGRYERPQRKISPATLRDVPVKVLLNSMPERLRPDITADVEMTVCFSFPDSDRSFTFVIRRGVGEILSGKAEGADLEIIIREKDFRSLIGDRFAGLRLMATGHLKIRGGLNNLMAFKNYLLEP